MGPWINDSQLLRDLHQEVGRGKGERRSGELCPPEGQNCFLEAPRDVVSVFFSSILFFFCCFIFLPQLRMVFFYCVGLEFVSLPLGGGGAGCDLRTVGLYPSILGKQGIKQLYPGRLSPEGFFFFLSRIVNKGCGEVRV